MTVIGGGGVRLTQVEYSDKFKKDFKSLDPLIQLKAESKIQALFQNPRPSGLVFEKLKGYKRPDIYTIHVTGNFKISLQIDGSIATLRRIGVHNTIDRTP
jgi:mRNA-degrading endonuclease RelE of RelBE toxin-antitoxin system